MELNHRVRVPAGVDEVWEAVLDPARVAVVLPGAVVDEAADDTFSGAMKIKLGSTLLALAGSGRYESRDAAARRVVVSTTGADRRGDGGVEATHTITLSPVDGGAAETDVDVATSITLSGRPGRLGDGVIGDAVARVLDQLGSRTAARVSEGLPWVPPARGETASDDALTAAAVVDRPVELGADLGAVDEPEPVGSGAGPRPSPSARPSPRAPRPAAEPTEYVYKPFSNTAQPHVDTARTLTRLARSKLLPYAGLGALAAFAALSAVRRARR